MKKTSYQKCYNLALYYLAKRQHSIFELSKKLKDKEHKEEDISKVVEKLSGLDLLDDEVFAFSRIRYRYKTCRWGVIRIRRELQEKGVNKEIIDQSIEKRYEDGTLKNDEICKQAFELISSRYKNKVILENGRINSKDFNRITGFLSRRGYTYPQIKYAIDELILVVKKQK
ncbi:MAG: regulatory protein RecX [Proteobacteria bacterium]|nr:regulatory protein RecX [Pseudomonadota bacterium]